MLRTKRKEKCHRVSWWFSRIKSPYVYYRMWKSNSRPYFCRSVYGHGKRTTITWASSKEQCERKLLKWECICLIPHRKK